VYPHAREQGSNWAGLGSSYPGVNRGDDDRHPFLHSAQIQWQGQNPLQQAHFRERNRIERVIGRLKRASPRNKLARCRRFFGNRSRPAAF
jgi:hypothetical protein